MLKKLVAIILGGLAIIVVSGNCVFPGRLAWAESKQTGYAGKSSAAGYNAAEADHENHEGAEETGEEHGKFPGYEVVLALIGCAYFALILKIWPILFGKHEEGHP